MGLKADFQDDAPATLVVVLARQPLFFRETNPQPRKHTLWQATADFTDGQASLHRKHFLQVPHGLLNKHFEKLIQCDMRLNFLSQQPEITLDSPYFESQPSVFDSTESINHCLDQSETSRGPSVSIFEDVGTPVSQSSSMSIKHEDALQGTSDILSREATSPSSVMDMRVLEVSTSNQSGEVKGSKTVEELIMQGIRPSMSMTDLVNHIGNCISEQRSSEFPTSTEEGSDSRNKMLEDITQHLLGDIQFTPCSDEKSLMSRVNSLCSLLQKDDTPVQTFEVTGGGKEDTTYSQEPGLADQNANRNDINAPESSVKDGCKQAPVMPRTDSFVDLLHHLPSDCFTTKVLV
ncbi:Cytosolic phospholipase A2 beta [Bienertia sinuspersici]